MLSRTVPVSFSTCSVDFRRHQEAHELQSQETYSAISFLVNLVDRQESRAEVLQRKAPPSSGFAPGYGPPSEELPPWFFARFVSRIHRTPEVSFRCCRRARSKHDGEGDVPRGRKPRSLPGGYPKSMVQFDPSEKCLSDRV